MNLVGISGSPRLGGNTATLLSKVLAGAREQGASIRRIDVARLNIRPCINCERCPGTGCIYSDDMQIVYNDLNWADAVTISSPLHFMTVPAQLKMVMDRLQLCWTRKYRLNLPPLGIEKVRKGLFIGVGGRKGDHLFDAVSVTIKAVFRSLDIEYWGELVYAGIDAKGDIDRQPEALEEAFQAGTRLACGQPF